MAQKYKIYINESILILCSEAKRKKQLKKHTFHLAAKYSGQKKSLFNYIDSLEKSKKAKSILIYHHDFKALKYDFLSLYTIVEAGGGIVLNEKNEILFIFRRKFWDLPKGKIDPGETIDETAIREVIEETGIKQVILLKKLGITNHYFACKLSKRCIKKSHWYFMETKKQKLTPQKSEDIEKAVWMTLDEFNSVKRPIYKSIEDILIKVQKKLSK